MTHSVATDAVNRRAKACFVVDDGRRMSIKRRTPMNYRPFVAAAKRGFLAEGVIGLIACHNVSSLT